MLCCSAKMKQTRCLNSWRRRWCIQQVQNQTFFPVYVRTRIVDGRWLFIVPGEDATVQVFGKVHSIPRKQAAYGDAGLTYTYSGVTRLACTWTPTLEYIRDVVTNTTGQTFNFVLVNRWETSFQIRVSCVSPWWLWSPPSPPLQVQRWAGSHGWASWWWEGAGPLLSHRLRLPRSSTRLNLSAQRRSGKTRPPTDQTREAGARARKLATHELTDQHLLVPQPPCTQKDLPASHQPHLQTHPAGEKEVSERTLSRGSLGPAFKKLSDCGTQILDRQEDKSTDSQKITLLQNADWHCSDSNVKRIANLVVLGCKW